MTQKVRVIQFIAEFLSTQILFIKPEEKEIVAQFCQEHLLLTRRNVKGREKRNAASLAAVQLFTNTDMVEFMFQKCQGRVVDFLNEMLASSEHTAICQGDVNRLTGHFAVLFRFILGVFRCEGEWMLGL